MLLVFLCFEDSDSQGNVHTAISVVNVFQVGNSTTVNLYYPVVRKIGRRVIAHVGHLEYLMRSHDNFLKKKLFAFETLSYTLQNDVCHAWVNKLFLDEILT